MLLLVMLCPVSNQRWDGKRLEGDVDDVDDNVVLFLSNQGRDEE